MKKERGNKKRTPGRSRWLYLLPLGFALLSVLSCRNPLTGPENTDGTRQLHISVQPGGDFEAPSAGAANYRTAVPDASTYPAIGWYEAAVTDSATGTKTYGSASGSSTSLSVTVTAPLSSALRVTVRGYTDSTKALKIAEGSVPAAPDGTTLVTIYPAADGTGTGKIDLEVRFPNTIGVTAVAADLYKGTSLNNADVFSGLAKSSITSVQDDPDYSCVKFTASGVPSGGYLLKLVFTRTGTKTMTVIQAVNIRNGATTSKWIPRNGGGTLLDYLLLEEDDFFSTNTGLGGDGKIYWEGDTIRFTLAEYGQSFTATLDGTDITSQFSYVADADNTWEASGLDMVPGSTYTFTLTVTAPDGVTKSVPPHTKNYFSAVWYVDENGSDVGNGSASAPLASVQAAVDAIIGAYDKANPNWVASGGAADRTTAG
ncbi:hypothetical protein K7I13_05685 [Brucepastera parasyntrophica]|uniref:hypothetical protein n=1 Tax=Brucepastera parasyntrophica TaxID=2880008 RepID=UPI00210AE68C|nr:hypothetical protein [Brucepastera parasyntrophica]ULQ60760.1 hypothetical protein K7I13_05685 [Brucepastera parasyntrophica]